MASLSAERPSLIRWAWCCLSVATEEHVSRASTGKKRRRRGSDDDDDESGVGVGVA